MPDSLQFYLPAYTAGQTAYEKLPPVVRPFGPRLLLAGGHKALAAGRDRLLQAIQGTDLKLLDTLHYGNDCTLENAQALADKAIALGAQVLCGMGGGRALDTVKAAGHLCGLPVVTLPTQAATCAAVTGLSVLYDNQGHFDHFLRLRPPVHAFIDTTILAAAPPHFLRAGLGDSLAKHVESLFAARGGQWTHADGLGLSIAEGLLDPILTHGPQAMQDAAIGKPSSALEAAALASIVSTGCVSLLVREDYNGALAHSLYYALEALPAARHLLHGDTVAWGAVVQLVLDDNLQKAALLKHLLRGLGIPDSLQAMGLDITDSALQQCLQSATSQPDMRCLPYAINGAMILRAVQRAEHLEQEG